MRSSIVILGAIAVPLMFTTACQPRVPLPAANNQPPATKNDTPQAEQVADVPKVESPAKADEVVTPAGASPQSEPKSPPAAEPTAESPKESIAVQDDAKADLPNANPPAGEAAEKSVVVSSTAKEDPENRERVLLLAPGGPLLIDVVLRFEGHDFAEALKRLVEEAYRIADEDGDGKTTWEALAQNPRFRTGEFGNLVADTDEEVRQLISIYDVDNDGLVDREELPRFLTRNAGEGRSFTIRISNEFRSSNRRRSPTRLLIDADRDGGISREEAKAAPLVILNRDSDSDEVVTLAEMKESANEMMAPPMMMTNRRRVAEPDTAVWLTDKNVDFTRRWGMVQFQIQEVYSYGENISSSDWPLVPELFESLDADKDGELNRSEVSRLAEVAPHFILEIDFDQASANTDPATSGPPGPRIRLRNVASDIMALKPVIRELPTRISLQFQTTEVEMFVVQDPTLSNVVDAAKNQFGVLDRDKNGYLDEEEAPDQIPGQNIQFESLDSDQDGKVYERELIAYLEQRTAVARAQVRARVADQEDALFTALDTDGDGRLNSREIRLAPDQINAFDTNEDGRTNSDEIPGSMVIGFLRGNPQQDNQLFATAAASARPAPDSIPRWFLGMDANADLEISRREFFGTQDKFQRLDTDSDGFISVDEARTFDGKKS